MLDLERNRRGKNTNSRAGVLGFIKQHWAFVILCTYVLSLRKTSLLRQFYCPENSLSTVVIILAFFYNQVSFLSSDLCSLLARRVWLHRGVWTTEYRTAFLIGGWHKHHCTDLQTHSQTPGKYSAFPFSCFQFGYKLWNTIEVDLTNLSIPVISLCLSIGVLHITTFDILSPDKVMCMLVSGHLERLNTTYTVFHFLWCVA